MALGSYLLSLCLSILICKMGIKMVNPPHRVVRLNEANARKMLRPGLGTQAVLHECELFSLLWMIVLESAAPPTESQVGAHAHLLLTSDGPLPPMPWACIPSCCPITTAQVWPALSSTWTQYVLGGPPNPSFTIQPPEFDFSNVSV